MSDDEESFAYAMQFRDIIKRLALEEFTQAFPRKLVGTVQSYNIFNKTAQVLMKGDDEPITVHFTDALQPSAVGEVVEVEGTGANRYIKFNLTGKLYSSGPAFLHPRFMGGSFGNERAMTHFSLSPAMPPDGNVVEFRPFGFSMLGAGGIQGGTLKITVQTNVFGSVTKHYDVPLRANGTNSIWQKLFPITRTGHSDTSDFELEIWCSVDTLKLRIRKTLNNDAAPLHPAAFAVDIWTDCHDIEFLPDTTESVYVAAACTSSYGNGTTQATSYRYEKGPLLSPEYDFPRMKDTHLTGGGKMLWDGTNFSWATRFMLIGPGKSAIMPDGFFQITMPAAGSSCSLLSQSSNLWSEVAGAWTADGINLGIWQTLYYELPLGGTAASLPGNFRVIDWGANFTVPPHWVMIAQHNGDAAVNGHPSLKVGTGAYLDHWKSLSLLNSWQYYGAPFEPIGYRIDENRFVTLRGLVRLGTAVTVIANLPANYRPGFTTMYIVENSGNAVCRINIATNGDIAQQRGNNTYVALSGIRFLAEL